MPVELNQLCVLLFYSLQLKSDIWRLRNQMKFVKILGANLFAIVVVVVLILTIISLGLNSYTRHGQSLTVPDIKGIPIKDAITILEQKKLRYEVIDSLYFDDKPKLSILEQNPQPQSKVKEGRIIYLTINSDAAPKVAIPNLIDVSLRQAQAMLLAAGLKTGQLIYKPDIAQNVVLEQQVSGQSVAAGDKIAKGTSIDLVLGSGLEGAEVPIPDLTGLSLDEAGNLLQSSSLNLGAVVYQGVIKDSTQAKVFRQQPPYSPSANVTSGQPIDLFLKQ